MSTRTHSFRRTWNTPADRFFPPAVTTAAAANSGQSGTQLVSRRLIWRFLGADDSSGSKGRVVRVQYPDCQPNLSSSSVMFGAASFSTLNPPRHSLGWKRSPMQQSVQLLELTVAC
uniref:Uncharacterized protein n=1 Tax=Physcomitrium patens TaxID=3218 RepID=A0A2K1L274_PHYPA|nr:hypothetical protein PHYPA_002909 [Physcomitrium patens]